MAEQLTDNMPNSSRVSLRNSIATRLLSYVFSIYLVISVIITVIHMVYEYKRVEKNVIQDLKIFYSNSNPTMAVALWEADGEQMDSILNGFVKSPTILGLRISDLSGKYVRTIGESIDLKEELRFVGKGEEGILIRQKGRDLFGFQYPIVYARKSGNHKIGSMTIYSSPSVIFSRVKFSYLFIFINAIIKTIILWVVFLGFSRVLLQRPLSILTLAAKNIDLENLEEIQIDTKTSGRNEFKILEEAFNSMVVKLLEARNDIAKNKEKQNQRLERQVIERTQELSDSEERYRRLVESAPFGIAIHQAGALVFMNAAGKKIIYGSSKYSEDKLISEMVPPEFYKKVTRKIQGLMIADNPVEQSFEEKIIRLDGNSTDVEVVGIHFIYNGKPAVQVVFQDITDRKKWEASLRKERKQAEKESQAKGRFLANMSHELRTPLNAILGLSQLMTKNSNLNHDQKDNLHIISRSGKHLLDLINDILDMSKIEAKKTLVIEGNLSLVSFLEDLNNLFKFQAKKKKLTLHFEQSSDIPEYVRTDEVKLRQILTNLINNALKFTEKGGVILRISTEKKGSSQNKTGKKNIFLNFEIEDTGPGIPPDEIEQIFDPFVQIHTGHGQKEGAEGTGLGLSISLKFAQLMGGDILVESEPESGSVFKLTVPVSPGNCEQNQTKNSPPVIGLDSQHKCRTFKGEEQNQKIVMSPDQMYQAIVNLPWELKNEFKEAVLLVDFDKALILLDKIQEENKPLADILRKHVNGYQFNILQILFDKVTG